METKPANHWFHTLWQIIVGSFCVYWFWHPPVPNKAVLVITLVTVVMALLDMGRGHKAIYLVLVICLMSIENRAINKDRMDAATAESVRRDAENTKFQNIADGLTTSIQQSQTQFQATMKQAGQILQTTQQVGTLAQENLENITGGESFAIITPQVWSGLVPIPLSIRNFGKQTLTGVSVTILDSRSWDLSSPRNFYESSVINVGTLHPTELRLLKEALTPIESELTDGNVKVVQYQINIAAQNFTAEEHLVFKRGTKVPWDFQYSIVRQFVKSQNKNKTTYGYKLLAKTEWTGE